MTELSASWLETACNKLLAVSFRGCVNIGTELSMSRLGALPHLTSLDVADCRSGLCKLEKPRFITSSSFVIHAIIMTVSSPVHPIVRYRTIVSTCFLARAAARKWLC